jgi:hypothetical protein
MEQTPHWDDKSCQAAQEVSLSLTQMFITSLTRPRPQSPCPAVWTHFQGNFIS